MLAAYLPLGVTIPLAIAGLVGIIWYWNRLGHSEVPETQRRVRRASLCIMIVGDFMLVAGLSLVDPNIQPHRFTVVWGIVTSLLLVLIFIAFLDVLNNFRIQRRVRAEAAKQTLEKLRQAAEESRQASGENSDTFENMPN